MIKRFVIMKKLRGYTKNDCLNAALQYKSRGDFRLNSPIFYNAASKHGWLDEICSHMRGKVKKKAGYWDLLDNCIQTAKRYSNRVELRKNEKGCHDAILKHGWQDICFSHMNSRIREYTIDQLVAIALKYKNHRSFITNDSGAYYAAKNKGILDEITKHMSPKRIIHKFDQNPSKKECQDIARKYETRKEFRNQEPLYYNYIYHKGWLDEICSHMPFAKNLKKRCVYKAEFQEDHSVYVGLTYDTVRRWQDHITKCNSAVYIHMKETGFEPVFNRLTDYVSCEEAKANEQKFVELYKCQGWNVLNRAKAGSLGAVERGYTKEQVIAKAKEYRTLKEFRENAAGYYEAGYRSEYWNEIREICKPHLRIFSYDYVMEIAKQYATEFYFRRKEHAVYDWAKRNGILDKICEHMVRSRKVKKYSEDDIRLIVKSCTTRYQLQVLYPAIYQRIRREGRLDELCAHMKQKNIQQWNNLEVLCTEAKKYLYRSDFQKESPSAYRYALKYGLLDIVCEHMLRKSRTQNYECYNIEDAKRLASLCKGRSELQKTYLVAYKMLKNAGLLDVVLPRIHNSKNYRWTKEKRREAALKCNTRNEFKKNYPQAYDKTRELGELDELCSHMPKRIIWTEELLIMLASQCSSMKDLKTLNINAWYYVTKHKGKSAFVRMHFKK